MKLILIRHAKSSWDDPLQDDHDRPLNRRGRHDAPLIGQWLRDHGHLPRQVTLSSATRVQETWAHIAPALPPLHPRTEPRLYHAGPETILSYARGSNTDCHLIIAHNPGIAEFCHLLLRRPPDHPRFNDFPTAATLVADIGESDWHDLTWGGARSLGFITPHDLT